MPRPKKVVKRKYKKHVPPIVSAPTVTKLNEHTLNMIFELPCGKISVNYNAC